ncbi:Endopolyphosphatase [Gryganskiella cystojenkinii]|nr:Endopolyphosphatase [Gryganskiella cystojenkinii]
MARPRHQTPRFVLLCCFLSCLWHLHSCVEAKPSSSFKFNPYDPDESRLVGQFLHMTDIHPDEHYMTGGSISSSCHRNTTDDDDDDLRMMRPGRTDGGYGGKYGSPYTICDSPFTLANATFDWIDKNLIGSIDFVVWTGDNARHDSDNEHPRTQKEIEDLNKIIANRILETFAPDKDDPFQQRIPIVPSIGNNDVYPHNIMQAGPNRILQHFSDIWSDFIPESQLHTFQFGGYYTSEVVPGKITVVALNTLYFFNQNAAVDGCDREDEPGTEQMDWLEVELVSLRRRKMAAYLTGHVPPARKSYSASCYVRYTDIALRFQDVIVGHLFGHANIDHFFILSQSTIDDNNNNHNNIQEEATTDQTSLLVQKSGNTQRSRSMLKKEDDDEYDPFHALGLSSYLIELWEQYEDIPKKAKINDYAIALVGPSVVPTYNPSLRVYSYQLAIEKGEPEIPDVPEDGIEDGGDDYEDDDDEFIVDLDDLHQDAGGKKKKKKKPKKPRKPRRPANPAPAPPISFGFPLNYTQYWVNLTQANLEPEKQPEYVVEYRSREDYGLQDLSTTEWLALARRIVKSDKLKDQYLAWMVVLTGTENEH